jgi:hypothetical protein
MYRASAAHMHDNDEEVDTSWTRYVQVGKFSQHLGIRELLNEAATLGIGRVHPARKVASTKCARSRAHRDANWIISMSLCRLFRHGIFPKL